MTFEALANGKQHEGDPGGRGPTPFPEEEAFMMIYGCPTLPPPLRGEGLCMANLSPCPQLAVVRDPDGKHQAK
jgi:hypothetical protein